MLMEIFDLTEKAPEHTNKLAEVFREKQESLPITDMARFAEAYSWDMRARSSSIKGLLTDVLKSKLTDDAISKMNNDNLVSLLLSISSLQETVELQDIKSQLRTKIMEKMTTNTICNVLADQSPWNIQRIRVALSLLQDCKIEDANVPLVVDTVISLMRNPTLNSRLGQKQKFYLERAAESVLKNCSGKLKYIDKNFESNMYYVLHNTDISPGFFQHTLRDVLLRPLEDHKSERKGIEMKVQALYLMSMNFELNWRDQGIVKHEASKLTFDQVHNLHETNRLMRNQATKVLGQMARINFKDNERYREFFNHKVKEFMVMVDQKQFGIAIHLLTALTAFPINFLSQ